MEIIAMSERIVLKVFDLNDIDAAKSFWGDQEVMNFCGGATSYENLPRVLEWYRKCHEENGLSVYAVVERATGKTIGAAGFNIKGTLDDIELIYHFSKSSWGKGFASEAAIASVEFAKKNSKVKKIHASADPSNAGSLKILEKAGLHFLETRWFDDTNREEPYYELKL
ncbi:GNAT family N-acetyltransferase [Bacillus tianshenii]|uniref:GNAT family N-acetyltransferase n=1 Tax=Sutcliffiella tianshenii TaxID=1463404 RepID=UPI001CD700F4|nr:GNAT family N-acetyltransferase [Bacillus tianshenii]MCA1320827.1 GNAT family N-acetyltransferase [Bacillus tianshenii]